MHYRVCDVTDASAVRRLCDEFGSALRLIIHNAGVDRPVRLPQKSADSFVETVRTKVLGFAHLCAAAARQPQLVQFCNVGSLTGRWGGMTGETDTRYLIVTHNAVTMSRMHRLYGVTMIEKGVSRLVSVDLGGAETLLAAE